MRRPALRTLPRRALAAWLLALALGACGKYGPPVRQAPPPAQPAGEAQQGDEEERP